MTFTSRYPEPPRQRMSAEEFLAWSENQPGRYELVDGLVYAQAAERAAHAEMKGLIFLALICAIKKRGLSCHALVDGMAAPVGVRTVFEPDTLVYCGPKLPPDAQLIDNPIIVVEVISPTTGRNDHTRKVAGYFQLDSVKHYLSRRSRRPPRRASRTRPGWRGAHAYSARRRGKTRPAGADAGAGRDLSGVMTRA